MVLVWIPIWNRKDEQESKTVTLTGWMDVNQARHAEKKTQRVVFLSAGWGCGRGSQLQDTIAGSLPRSFLGFVVIGCGGWAATLLRLQGWEALNLKAFITTTGCYVTLQPLETLYCNGNIGGRGGGCCFFFLSPLLRSTMFEKLLPDAAE